MTKATGTEPPSAADRVLEPAATGAALWHLAGNPDFPVPVRPNVGIPHGRILARVGRRVVGQYGHRLDAEYVEILKRLFDQCEALHFRLIVRKDPFSGFQEESVIVRAFYEAGNPRSELVQHQDALRCWLLVAVDKLKPVDAPEKAAFLKRLAMAAERLDPRSEVPGAVLEALRSSRMIAASEIEHWIDALHWPARYKPLAVITLCGERAGTSAPVVRPRLPAQPVRPRVRRRPVGTPQIVQGTHPDEIPEEDVVDVAVEIEIGGVDHFDDELEGLAPPQSKADLRSRKIRGWAKQDARLRIVDGLLPHTELALTDREARDFYLLVSRQVAPVSGQPDRDQNLVIDVMLLLMLLTSRDYVSILHALHHHLTSASDFNELNVRIAEDAWFSLPDHPLPDLEPVDPRFHSPYQRDIELPLPTPVKTGIRYLRRYDIDPLACVSDEIEARLREFKQALPRLTLGRLRNTLPTLLYTVTGHPRTIQLIVGTDGFRSPAPMHYYAPTHATISGHYARALGIAGIAVSPRMLRGRLRVGAPRGALEIGPVAAAIGHLVDRLRGLERTAHGPVRTADLYNAVAVYTALMFATYTAHRFSSSLSQTTLRQFIEFPSGAGVAVFDDKRGDGSTLRVAALPPEFFAQLNYLRFVAHRVLRYARGRLGANHAVTHALEGSLTGSAPVWSWLDWAHGSIEPVNREKLQQACDRLNVSVVLLRHLFATTSEEGGMSGADIGQQMGHRIDHTPYANVDLDSPREFAERAAPFLSRYGGTLNLVVISTRRGQENGAWSDIPGLPVPDVSSSLGTDSSQAQVRKAEENDGVQEADDQSLELIDEAGSVWVRLLESESRIGPGHLEAYRTAYVLESHLTEFLRRGSQEKTAAGGADDQQSRAQMCALRMLVCIWGVTTDPERLRDIELHGTLWRVESSPWAVLWSPARDARTGVQLVSAEQAPLVQRLCHARSPLDATHTLEDLKAVDQGLCQILGSADFGTVLQVIAAARQLTTPAHRAAWERGALVSTGLRADRLLALLCKKSVARLPEARPEEAPWSATELGQYAFGGDAVAGYRSVRQALGDYKDRPTEHHREVLSKKIRALSPKTAPGSLPRLLLNAIEEELDTPRIKVSSLYAYVTRLSRVVMRSLTAPAESVDPEFIEESLSEYLVLGSQRKGPRLSSRDRHHALAWLMRRNSPEDIGFDVAEALDGSDTYVKPARAGDPISQTEMRTLLTLLLGLQYGDSPRAGGSVDRTAWVLELAAVVQGSHALRLREVWGLTSKDVKVSRDRCEISVRPRRRFGLKGPASKRIVSRPFDDCTYEIFRRLHERIHPQLIDEPTSVELLPLPGAAGYRDWRTIFYSAFNAVRGLVCQGRAAFRPHSHRHSYATGQAMKMQPEQFEHVVLDLPGELPNVVMGLPRRVQYRYMSRQLGHGDPETTLRYYDHSVPMMLLTIEGWRGPDPALLAAQLGISNETFKKRVQRQRGLQPRASVVIDCLDLPDLAATFEIGEFPANGPVNLADPGVPPRTLEFVAQVAHGFRSGRSAQAIAAEFDVLVEAIQDLEKRLVDAERILQVNYGIGNQKIVLQRSSRTEKLVKLLGVVEQGCENRLVLCKRLFRVHTAFLQSANAGRGAWESLVHDVAPESFGIGPGRRGRALLRIVIFVFLEEFCANG